jgi:hypothetical protein
MSVTPYIFDGGALTAAAVMQGVIVPLLTKRVIKAASAINTTAAPIALSVYLVPALGIAGPANSLISARSIGPGESYQCPELVNQGLNPGGSLQALGNGLTFKYTAVDFV